MGVRVVESQLGIANKGTASDYLKDLLATTAPRQQVAGMTPTEQFGQDYLSEYVRSGMPQGYSTSYDYLNKLLTQPTDITQLPEYKAILGTGTTAMNEAINQALRRTQLGGMGASSSQGRAATRAGIEGAESIMARLAPLAESERNRQMTAAQFLPQLDQIVEAIKQGRISATQFASLPREIQNQINQALYVQQMMPFTTQAQLAQALSGISLDTIFQQNPTSTDRWMQYLGMTGEVGGKLGAAAIMASDERVKEHIESLTGAVHKVKQITGKVYNYKTNDPIDRRIGVLAQDVQRIMPEAVKDIGGILHVDYGAVATLAAQAVKELSKEIDVLKKKKVA